MSIKESLNFQLNSDIDIQINVWNYSCFYQVKDFFSLKKVKRTKKKKKRNKPNKMFIKRKENLMVYVQKQPKTNGKSEKRKQIKTKTP